jgi:MFS family permease
MIAGAILSVRTLLLAIFVLMAGSGFLSTLISVRLEARGAAPLLIGLVATMYFAGLTLGSLRVPAVIQRVGHIRAFAAFVSLFSASSLIYAVAEPVGVWAALRFIDGLCMAGVFVCLESWLNERAETRTRGAILAAYMISLYSGQAVGQFLLNVGEEARPSLPFMASAILLSLAVIPVVLTRIAGPSLSTQPPMGLARLYRLSPLAIVGAIVTGVMMGAFYGLGAVYAGRLGMDLSGIAVFMSAVIVGGVALQWPLGRLSDVFDRRRVIVGAFGGATVAGPAMAAAGAPGPVLLLLGGLFGGISFALYPLCVAHANDHLSPEQRVGASGGLVLAYSTGAAAGPVLGAAAMTMLGAPGLFLFIGACAGGACAFALWRERIGMPVPSARQRPYQILPRTTPMSAALDPLAPGDAP